MVKLVTAILIGFALFSCSAKKPFVAANSQLDDFLIRQAKLGSAISNYRVYVPGDRQVGERLPMMLYLHGADERGEDNRKQVLGISNLIKEHPERFSMIIVFPQCESGHFWDSDQLFNATIALNDAAREFDGDESRIFLVGYSLGAYGVWSLAARDRYNLAAIVPISGRVLPRANEKQNLSNELKELTDSPDPYAALAERLADLPVWVFHGAEDKTVPSDEARKMVQALRNAGNANVQYSELAGVGHDSLGTVFEDAKLFEWLLSQKNQNISYDNVPITDDTVYGAVIEALAYDENNTFGSIGGGMRLLLKRKTISPDNPNELNSIKDLPDDLRNDFLKNNKAGDRLCDGYDAKVYISTTDQPGSPGEIFKAMSNTKPATDGVMAMSKVGFDSNHSRSLVYVEFFNSNHELIKHYCLINWKRDGHGVMVASRRWLL